MQNIKASRNKTIVLSNEEETELRKLISPCPSLLLTYNLIENKLFTGDALTVIPLLPEQTVDLLIADPPYNMDKTFNNSKFSRRSSEKYAEWLESWISLIPRIMKPTASIYVCTEWRSSAEVQKVLEKYFIIRNRITWEREKGRGSKQNWKNSHEDIFFCTVSDNYTFNIDAVKLKRKVIAPYRLKNGKPKDWEQEDIGKYRLTHPSNLWTDISVPFWSMSENTSHPTQKPEKLIAKLILASSCENDLIFDPFCGSGTTLVTAKKLNRKFTGIEIDEYYSLLTLKRLLDAEIDKSIQGYNDGFFWERNSVNNVRNRTK